jgi:hypothetical protein
MTHPLTQFITDNMERMESDPMFAHVCSITVAAENTESLVKCSCGKRFLVRVVAREGK